MIRFLFILVSLYFWGAGFFCNISAQNYNRVKADFSIKSKNPNGSQSLTVGQVFYDRNIKQLIYYLTFPEKEIWVTEDTIVYQIRDGNLISRSGTFAFTEFTIYHLALVSGMQDFGLKNSRYQIGTVTRENEQVITTWVPPEKAKDQLGNILVSIKKKQLFGVVFLDKDENVIRKQFFENYQLAGGLSFPGKIVEINTTNGISSYQVTTYKNIAVDELENDSKYYYNVGGLRL
jgi:hypothetical protein